MRSVVVTGGFDDLKSRHIRFLEEASRQGDVHVLLWSDKMLAAADGHAPKFLQEERLYVVQAIRYVHRVTLVTGQSEKDLLADVTRIQPEAWVVDAAGDALWKRDFSRAHGMVYRVLTEADLEGFPELQLDALDARKKVIVTGCFDWFHSGHVRFFEAVSELGDLYVCVGHDENVKLLKGEGHPMFPQDERRYVVQAIRYVKQGLVSSGSGWMDAEPEIGRIKPDIYAVNEDGDKPEKKVFCETHGLAYVVLKRTPKEGLPRRTSTNLRGF